MLYQLIARHIRDDQDIVLEESDNAQSLFERMLNEMAEDREKDWRYSIVPHPKYYQLQEV